MICILKYSIIPKTKSNIVFPFLSQINYITEYILLIIFKVLILYHTNFIHIILRLKIKIYILSLLFTTNISIQFM